MRIKIVLAVVVCLFVFATVSAIAQEASPVPKVLQIFREEVKPGKALAHAQHEAGWPRAFAKANWQTHYLALTSITGPSEAWYVTPFESLEAWEKDTRASDANEALSAELAALSTADGEMLSSVRSIVAVHRPELSYGPAAVIPKMRYFGVTTTRVKPGQMSTFIEATNYMLDAHKKVDMKESWATFEVVAGAPSGTFLTIFPVESLKDVDANREMHNKGYRDAVAEVSRNRWGQLVGESVQMQETNYFSFSPKMSFVSKEFIAADPEYWTPKEVVATKPGKKPKGKTVAQTQ
jgi:hypothetical protein